jgi:ABC-2 type transport system ATP-binding protein
MSLTLVQIQKSYGDIPVLDMEHFRFDPGAYWIQGGNGAGKTTLLKVIAGMLPFSGNVSSGNLDLKKNRQQYLQTVSYAPAEPVYPEFLNGRELIEFYGECRNADSTQIEELLATTGVKKFSEGKTGTYSSGMVKKLSLMLAFIGEPSVILLDEPLITIDKDSVHFIYELMQQFVSVKKGILLFTTHQVLFEENFSLLSKLNLVNGKLERG